MGPACHACVGPKTRLMMTSIRLLTLIIVLVMAATGISSPLLTLYLAQLGADFARISLILTTYAGILLGCNYLWGRVSDWLGRRKPVIVGGLAGLALSYSLLGRVPTAEWAWVVRMLEGVSLAAYLTASLALMGDWLAQQGQRGRRMGTYRGIGSLGFAAGALVGGRLADHFSLALAISLCAGLYLLAALCALSLREVSGPAPEPVAAPDEAAKTPAQEDRSTPSSLPRLFLAGVFLWILTWNASASMWPNYLASLGYTKTAISSLWGLAAFIEMPAMALVGVLSDALGRAPLLMAGAAGAVLVMMGYVALAHILPALAGVQVLRGFTFASYTATAMTVAAEHGPQHTRGTNSGLYHAVSSAGQLLGLLMGGTLAQARGFGFLFGVCAVSALLSVLSFWGMQRKRVVVKVERLKVEG